MLIVSGCAARYAATVGLVVFLAACGNDARPPGYSYDGTKSGKIGAARAVAQYDSQGRLKFPSDYRRRVFLSSGHGMSYRPGPAAADPPFDNVFVDLSSYNQFVKAGTWPEGTMLVLEIRDGQSKGSINRNGAFQTGDPLAVEVHLKDSKRFAGNWAFFSFNGNEPAQRIPATADCYSCHQKNAAVDTTFVQFYPTLLPIARDKRTLSRAFLETLRGHSVGRGGPAAR